MNSKKFSEAMGELDSRYVDEAINYKKKAKKPMWIKWGAVAAGFCLVAAGAVVISRQNSLPFGGIQTSDGGIAAGGGAAGDGLIGMYSVAVYPAAESEKNVASAEVVSLTESEAMNHPLAEHLPKQLPGGFHYGRGSVYNTVMKDGTEYNMLRVEYITGEIREPKYSEDGGVIFDTADFEAVGDTLTVSIFNFEPKTDRRIYKPEDITEAMLRANGGYTFHISYGDFFAAVSPCTAEPYTIIAAVKSIE